MVCSVCGEEFLVRHSCQGPDKNDIAPPEGLAVFHYLGEGLRIARWDNAAIWRVKDDNRALPYGILIWLVMRGFSLWALSLYSTSSRVPTPFEIFALAFWLLSDLVVMLLKLAVCHLIFKWFCAGEGRLIQIIRPMLLASVISLALAVPFVGPIVMILASVTVMMMIFQEVDGVEALTAFLISACVGVGLSLLEHFMFKTPF